MRMTDDSGSTFFVGREEFLTEIHELLQKKRQVVLSAPAGMGKTAIAAEYARRFSHAYEWIFSMNMASSASWLADCLELLERLAIPIADNERDLAGIKQILQNWLAQHPDALLIIDNIGSIALPLMPEQITGHMLCLTRHPVSDPSIAHLALGALKAEEGALLLLRQSGQFPANLPVEQIDAEVQAAARNLAEELAGLPLALHLAGANMLASGRSVNEFLDLYHQYGERLVQLKVSKGPIADELAIMCSLPAIRLQRTHQPASELLSFCTVLAPLAIPRELFLLGASELTPALQEFAQNPILLDEALARLSSLGLFLADEARGTLSLQLTVQEILRQAQTQEKRNNLITSALRAFSHLPPALEQAAPAVRVRIVAQILHLSNLSSDWIIPYEAVADAFGWSAMLLWEYGLIQDAETLLRKALAIWERVLGTGHETVGLAMRNLGILSALLENYAEAEAFLQRAMLARSRVLGAAHPEVILCLLDLARVYAEQGKSLEARACYEEALKIGEQTPGQGHPLLLAAAHELASICIEEGELAEAEQIYQRLCTFYETSSDQAQAEARPYLEHLALIYLQQGKSVEAESILQRLSQS
ncbi:MAG TPA: tetratricopeptide repeat protein [Ktedonobacteraceae bacterium]